ncbi:MAG TPA: pyruvoyl-dependent arginine decarboxylase [Patescibacteria group bacterium]|nr:pyruvoyl-dependent arginine decarboxylase [Patescibacteria group bacterium]
MKIHVSKGIGDGPTELAAFDHALISAGVANFNLIYLSSVIPPDSEIVINKDANPPVGEWGDRLYMVIAQKRTIQRNQEVWAGIGWMQDSKTHKGLLVEHEGHTEAEVRADIENSLHGLAKNRGREFGPIHMEVVGTRCEDKPVCALVVAVFESEPWQANLPENMTTLQRLARKLSL